MATVRADDWMPIETAPKDGTELQVWNGRHQHVAKWDRVEDNWVSTIMTVTKRIVIPGNVTRWRPLPAPPGDDKGGSDGGRR